MVEVGPGWVRWASMNWRVMLLGELDICWVKLDMTWIVTLVLRQNLTERGCWNKGVSQVTYWVLTITRYWKYSIGYAKQFVQVCRIHNQSTILRDSDWTSSRAKEFIWSLKHLKNCVWRNESEEELLKTRHQKR